MLSSSPVRRADHRHIPALDGLRGLAVLAVLLYHANGTLTGGYLGVDLFFVLSGFLITSLLLEEHSRHGRIDLKAFWIRRARRLFPALLLLMMAIALYARFIAAPTELSAIRGDALATLAYVANWRTILAERSYWDLFVSPSPLEHTWSLAIEEQFYLAWPIAVALLLRRQTSRSVLGLALGLSILSMAAMVALADRAGGSRAYLGTDTRAAGILVGAALATVMPAGITQIPTRAVRTLDAFGAAGAALLGVAWLNLDGQDPWLYRGGFWATEAAALVLIVCGAVGQRSVVARMLSVRPLRLLGQLSYGVYLWHWPINLVLTSERIGVEGLWLHALRFAVTFAVAATSYRFFEQPIRKKGIPVGRPLVVVPAAVSFTVALVWGATAARPLPPPPARLLAILSRVRPTFDVPEFRVLLFGDSTANALGWALRGLHAPGLSVDNQGKDGGTMILDTCNGDTWLDQQQRSRPHATLVFLGGAFLYGVSLDGRWRRACYPKWHRLFEDTLRRRLEPVAKGEAPVWVVTVPYALGPYDNARYRREVDCINRSIRKVSSSVPSVRILDFAEMLCPDGKCEREHNGQVIRPDGVHYAIEASRALAQRVLERITELPPGQSESRGPTT